MAVETPQPAPSSRALFFAVGAVTAIGLVSFANLELDWNLPEAPLLILRWLALVGLIFAAWRRC